MITFKNGASADYIDGFCRIFGDSKEFIHKIISVSNEVFEIYEDGTFCGGLCAIDVSIKVDNAIKTGGKTDWNLCKNKRYSGDRQR